MKQNKLGERETNGFSVNELAKITNVARSTIYVELKKL
ncbi:helix-turn-helix domain-containing protein [Bacillus salipaludis]